MEETTNFESEQQTPSPIIEKVSLQEIDIEKEKENDEKIMGLMMEALNIIHEMTPEEKANLENYLNKLV